MEWREIAGTVGRVAGALAPLLGGPAGMAVSIGSQIAGALGTDTTPEAVAAELRNNPDAALRLQEWAHREREQIRQANIRLQELDIERERIHLADVQHARSQHQANPVPARLTLALAAMVTALTMALLWVNVPTGSQDVVFYLAGQIVTAFLAAVTYWLGSSRGSADKQRKIEQLAERPAPDLGGGFNWIRSNQNQNSKGTPGG